MKIQNSNSIFIGIGWVCILVFLPTLSFADSYETTDFRNKPVSRDDFIEALKPSPSPETTNNGPFQFYCESLGIPGRRLSCPPLCYRLLCTV